MKRNHFFGISALAFALVIGFGLGFSGCSKTEEMELSQINELSNEVEKRIK